MFNEDVFDIDNDFGDFKIPLDQIPKRMNRYSIISIPYWKEIKMSHLLVLLVFYYQYVHKSTYLMVV